MNQIRQIQSTLQMLFTSLEPSRERAMVSRWREEITIYGARYENREKVLSAIKEGYDTLIEIVSETKIPRATCYKIIRRLLSENLITKTAVLNENKRLESRFELVSAEN